MSVSVSTNTTASSIRFISFGLHIYECRKLETHCLFSKCLICHAKDFLLDDFFLFSKSVGRRDAPKEIGVVYLYIP